MKQQKEMPKSGQFVAVWISPGGGTHSATLRIIQGVMVAYDHFDDSWRSDHTYTAEFFSAFGVYFFVGD